MMVGILAYVLRFSIYAWFHETTWLIVAINFVHGVCYAFFFASVYIFVDAVFPEDVRSSAQGLFSVMILGVGALIANSVGPWLVQTVFTENGITNFRSMFMIPIVISILSALVLAVGFKPPPELTTDSVVDV